jgi:glycosyltransferase involved in cell wall biosynthesis
MIEESALAPPKPKSDGRAKAAIFHDYFAIRGGGERLVLTLAEALEAALYCGYRTTDTYDEAQSLGLPAFLRRRGVRPFALALAFFMRRGSAGGVPLRIFSGVAAPFAAPRHGGNGLNIFYCHTPPRFLYDQREHLLKDLPAPLRAVAPLVLKAFEWGYTGAIARMDVIVANSENTRARILRFLDRESIVVHPPVDTDRFAWRGQDDYYLSTARLSPLKRVDRIVEAFLRMPDRKLVVASGGEDLEQLKRRAAGAPNIEFRGWVSDEALLDLVGNAIATIYLPRDEDFGMSPVESMAAGKPVIGVAEGGLLETIVHGETGILLPPDFSDEDLIGAVRQMTAERASAMRASCEVRAQDFTREKFVSAMREVIQGSPRKAAGKA